MKPKIYRWEVRMNRKYETEIWIKMSLINILKASKKQYISSATFELYQLRGAILYMEFAGDINEETYNKIYNLTRILQSKYHLY